ncbi:CbtA family protein [Aurantimonas sp. Leaf443]|uniref:CbtA family protein n=1 Tax=Aurantimonas sp. Leaf443 TaxID=1736378 RepID=UPI0006F4C285|nr:CbtA family protein [Aurantimonas sp. Leaf443]KQT88203.1 hypothetical protein ASG48_01830 [Aurantimonas sp. Leaf443]
MTIARSFLAALCVGLFVGVLMTPVQYLRVVPLIESAERYESGGGAGHDHAGFVGAALAGTAASQGAGETLRLAHSGAHADEHHAEGQAGAPLGSRLAGTLAANVVTGAGFALVLLSASLLLNRPLTAANGLAFGLAGFAAVALAPALGLPPELPAMPAADLGARQAWWALAAACTAGGLALLLLPRAALLRALGLGLLALPHVVGAPAPDELASPIPPTLAAEFAVASLATGAVFWALLGAGLGRAFDRLAARP